VLGSFKENNDFYILHTFIENVLIKDYHGRLCFKIDM